MSSKHIREVEKYLKSLEIDYKITCTGNNHNKLRMFVGGKTMSVSISQSPNGDAVTKIKRDINSQIKAAKRG